MALSDIFINNSSLRKRRDQAIEMARDRYDPSIYSPQADMYRERATEGVAEGVEQQRRNEALQNLFSDRDYSLYGGNQAAAVAGSEAQSQQASQAYSDFEQQLTQQDIQAQQQGRRGYAQTRTKQKQTAAQREAAVEQAELQYQNELERRRNKVRSTALSTLGTLATIPFGGANQSLVQRGLGALVGQGTQEVADQMVEQQPSVEDEMLEGTQPSQILSDEQLELDPIDSSYQPNDEFYVPSEAAIDTTQYTDEQTTGGGQQPTPTGFQSGESDNIMDTMPYGGQFAPEDFSTEEQTSDSYGVLQSDQNRQRIQELETKSEQGNITQDEFIELRQRQMEEAALENAQTVGMIDDPSLVNPTFDASAPFERTGFQENWQSVSNFAQDIYGRYLSPTPEAQYRRR